MGPHYVSHWFDGFAHSHKFDILPSDDGDGSVSVMYSSRRQAEDFVEEIRRNGWRSSTSFAQRADPCVGIFAKAMSVFKPAQKNNAVVIERNVPGLQTTAEPTSRTGTRNLFVMTDHSVIHEVHPETLEPVAYSDVSKFHPELTGQLCCAHSQRDPKTGDLFNFNLQFGRRPVYRVFRVNASTGKTDILATIPMPEVQPAYIHSLFLTENYVVLCVPSSHFAWNGLKIVWKGNIVEAIEPFDKSKLSQWLVIDRRHGKGIVARFTTPAGFFFHSVNAFEEVLKEKKKNENGDEEEHVYLNFDLVEYENCDIIDSFYYDVILDREGAARNHWVDKQGYNTCRQHLVRYCFCMPSASASDDESHRPSPASPLPSAEKIISVAAPHSGELPTINPAYATRPQRYVYGTSFRGLSTMMDSLCKTDMLTREALVWAPPASHTPGEAVFVGRPGAVDEDDGVLLSVVLDGTAQTSYLVCLDAKTMTEIGRAECEFAVGLGFHGVHAPELL
jgi:torulene dioxygenase